MALLNYGTPASFSVAGEWNNEIMTTSHVDTSASTSGEVSARGVAFAFVVLGALGLLAAFELTVEKLSMLADPKYVPNCDFGVLVSCNVNLGSWQGSVFGFANSLIGLMAWPVVITTGMALLAGARLARWYWWGLLAGLTFALGFVAWLIFQSIYNLGVLCPWCMMTWAVTIPTFLTTLLHVIRTGVIPLGEGSQRRAASLFAWIPLMTVVAYVFVLVLAQLHMDAIPRIISDLFG